MLLPGQKCFRNNRKNKEKQNKNWKIKINFSAASTIREYFKCLRFAASKFYCLFNITRNNFWVQFWFNGTICVGILLQADGLIS